MVHRITNLIIPLCDLQKVSQFCWSSQTDVGVWSCSADSWRSGIPSCHQEQTRNQLEDKQKIQNKHQLQVVCPIFGALLVWTGSESLPVPRMMQLLFGPVRNKMHHLFKFNQNQTRNAAGYVSLGQSVIRPNSVTSLKKQICMARHSM